MGLQQRSQVAHRIQGTPLPITIYLIYHVARYLAMHHRSEPLNRMERVGPILTRIACPVNGQISVNGGHQIGVALGVGTDCTERVWPWTIP